MFSFNSRMFEMVKRPTTLLGLGLLILAPCSLWFAGRMLAQGSDEIPFHKHTLDLGQSEELPLPM